MHAAAAAATKRVGQRIPPVRLPPIAVHSPRDGKVFASLADMNASRADDAIAAARACVASAWSSPSALSDRCSALRRLGGALRAEAEELAQLETRDCGKPIAESRADIAACADVCDYYADVAPRLLRSEALPVADQPLTARSDPYPAGVVGCITPWNYPLMQAVYKVPVPPP